MKTHTIKTPTAELLIVELHEGWDYEPVADDKTFIYHKTEEGTNDHHIEGYTLLGNPDEISEEDAAQLIPMYFDYEKTAVEYLVEKIESEIYWVNPYREKVFLNMDISASMVRAANREIYSEKWQETEKKTFDRNRALIFKKNK